MATKRKVGEYFSVSLTEIRAITHAHILNTSILPANSDTVSVYLILCRGAGKFDITAWKAYGISQRTNLTLTRINSAISWLIENGFIEKITCDLKVHEPTTEIEVPGKLLLGAPNQSSSTKYGEKYYYQISRHHTDRNICIPNLLVDGQRGHDSDPPLKRLLLDCKADFLLGIDIHAARLDAIVLLLQLYGEHSIDSYGGINPSVWQGTWTYSRRKEEFENSPLTASSSDHSYEFFSAQEQKQIFDTSILESMFSYIEDEFLLARRLEHALKRLRASRIVYQVIQVWGRLRGSNQAYDVMYPLHILDSSQRNQNEPAIGPMILEVATKYANKFEGLAQEWNRITLMGERGAKDSNASHNLNGVLFLAPKGASTLTLTTLRLRYRAHDEDTAVGIAGQQQMVKTCQQTLELLVSSA